jgi:adenylate cyclase
LVSTWKAINLLPLASFINFKDQKTIPLIALMTLGRSRDCTIMLPDHHVSRQHALVRQQGKNDYWFTDLGSINGSYINNKRVITSTRIHHGDIVRISHFEFKVDLPQEANPDKSDEPITDVSVTDVTLVDTTGGDVTMLVSDVRGYTRISEKLGPSQLAQVIGGWYKRCYLILHQEDAAIDKFIGDAVLAYWLGTGENEAKRALAAARGLNNACAELEQAHQAILAPHGLKFAAGVGIHMGPVTYSSIGSTARTIIGDAVNVTFRLEGLTRQIARKILLSGELVNRCPNLPDAFDFCGEFAIKGRSGVMEVYGID